MLDQDMGASIALEDWVTKLKEALDVGHEDISPETDLRALSSWDSLAVITVIALADEEFGVVLAPDTIADCPTVEQLYAVLIGS